MSKPHDVVTKRLLELRPGDWVDFLNLPKGPVSLMDADLSTVSVYADRLIRVDAPRPYCLHAELETGKNIVQAPVRLFHYGAIAFYKLGLPVVSNLFLLRREGNSPTVDGRFVVNGPDNAPYFTFRYNVVRVWQLDVEQILSGGLSLLPFAPIARVTEAELPRVIQAMDRRIESEATNGTEAAELWTATNVLMGLRYNEAFKDQVLQGVRRMRESITYQQILNEGREEGLVEGEIRAMHRVLLRQGVRRLGVPTAATEAQIESITSLITLELMLDRIFDVETWDDLLGSAST